MMKVVFVLPGGGGGGGSHSVVQEAIGLARLGVQASIAVREPERSTLFTNYPELEEGRIPTPGFSDSGTLVLALTGADIVVATTSESSVVMDSALAQMAGAPKPAHYLQDYEPLFFAPGTAQWDLAVRSFSAFPAGLRFAKSQWIKSIVEANHPVKVTTIPPSIDHDVFHPQLRDPPARQPITVCAMLRPKTPRRAPKRTARILSRLAEDAGAQRRVIAFGASDDVLQQSGITLPASVRNVGPLHRRNVAALLRTSDVFLDLSDYQAFGRTAVEAMACGCVPVAPVFGAAGEFINHGLTGLLVDTRSDEAILESIQHLIAGDESAWRAMRTAAITTALNLSVGRTSFSMLSLFEHYLGRT